jgi:hypothetical protein
MKKITVLLSFIFPAMLFAQSVSISSDATAPHSSAMLDIKSDSKGLLMPRLTTLQRTSVAGPATGLTVFDMDTYSYWMYRGDLNGGWAELQHNFQNFWGSSGSNIYNTNTGNTGLGTNTPAEKLSISATNPAIQFLNAGTAKGFLQANNNDMKLGTYANNLTGKLVFNTRAVDRMWIDENGLVGIGTNNPSAALTINGSNPSLQMRTGDINKGFLQIVTNNLQIGTNSTNTTGDLVFQTKAINRMLIDENGMVGIGTNAPSSSLTLNGTNPIFQLRNDEVDKGFIQLVDDDVKIGTNLSNSSGRFVVRTNGADRLFVSGTGNVGIGAASSFYKLDVIGDSRVTGDHYVEGLVKSENMEINSNAPFFEIHTTSNGTFGKIEIDNGNNVVMGKGFYGGALVLDGAIGSSTKRLYINKANQFNIGTGNNASGYTLSVEGKIIATDFTALPVGSWPDYVFADDYKLKPLSEVKKFITKNKHLPNIPAACEIQKNGIQLGDISKRLMEKVEELTLYLLQLQDQVDNLEKQIPQRKEK